MDIFKTCSLSILLGKIYVFEHTWSIRHVVFYKVRAYNNSSDGRAIDRDARILDLLHGFIWSEEHEEG